MTGALVAGGMAFLVAGAMVPLLVRFAVGRNLLDVPNLRSSHEVPTPRLGGVAIVFGTWLGSVLLMRPDGAWPLLIAATLIWAVGLVDDLGDLHFGTKAAAQALVASSLLLLYPPPILAEAPGRLLGAAVFLGGVFWIVAVSNAFNFMDGIDGFMGGIALISALFLIPLAGEAFLPALVGATAGFLLWNINPASIFLGDSGAYFLGFGLAAITLYSSVPGGGWSLLGFIAGVLVFTPLLFDTAFTLLRRLWAGKNIFRAHREHIYQRITPTTGLHRRTSNLYYGVSVASGFAALLVARESPAAFAGVALALGCCGFLSALPRLVK